MESAGAALGMPSRVTWVRQGGPATYVAGRALLCWMGLGGAACGGLSVYTETLPPEGCLVRSDEILVLSAEGNLWGFAPADFHLRQIGRLHCKGWNLVALAAAPSGDAYVADIDGEIFHVTSDATCDGPLLGPLPTYGFEGMSFYQPADGTQLLKFTAYDAGVNVNTDRLGTIDLATLSRTAGPLITAEWGLELAAGVDDRLFGVRFGNSYIDAALIELDPTTAETLGQWPFAPGIGGGALGATRWENTVYAFVANRTDLSSRTFRINVDDGAAHQLEPLPMRVIGAGSSTCAADRQASAEGR